MAKIVIDPEDTPEEIEAKIKEAFAPVNEALAALRSSLGPCWPDE